jgi:hypothetical protein
MLDDWSLLPIALYACAFLISLFVVVQKLRGEDVSNLPPLMGPGKLENMRSLTSVDDLQVVTHLMNLRDTMKDEDLGSSPRGSTFRLNVLSPYKHYIVTTDYRLGRLVLEGDAEKGIPESGKSTIARAFALYPGIFSIFA